MMSIPLSLLLSFLLCSSLTRLSLVSGDLRLLYQNDLSATASQGALFLGSSLQSVRGSAASSLCAKYSEQLLPNVTSDIQDQLNYLVYAGRLNTSQLVWIANEAGSGNDGGNSWVSNLLPRSQAQDQQGQQGVAICTAYSVEAKMATFQSCNLELPVLCTNSPSPFSIQNVSPASGSQVTAPNTSSGNFVGYRDARSFRFLSIPYAAPPTGSLRFQAAQPYTGSYKNFQATSFGPSCIQTASTVGSAVAVGNTQTSEDCLTLNIYTPYLPDQNSRKADLLPVAFWIYGGGYTAGAINYPPYDGGNMASRGDVVVVSINYRLGLLGFLASDELAGSQGITDQIQALKWVQSHISTFGGDPSQVTIFGQSAGAQSVIALLSSTPAKGLFSQAISQSAPWNAFLSKQVFTEFLYPAVLNATGCLKQTDAAQQLECLKKLPASAFTSNTTMQVVDVASAVAQAGYSGAGLLETTIEPILPVIGTGVIDGLFFDLVQGGLLPSEGVPVIIGNMENEGTGFVDSFPQAQQPLPYSTSLLEKLVSLAFDNATVNTIMKNLSLFPVNSSDPDALRDLVSQVVTLGYWQCPLQEILTTATQHNTFKAIYTYRFDKGIVVEVDTPSACTPQAPSGVQSICHGEDYTEVFGTANVLQIPFDGNYNNLQYSQYVQDTWTSFIRTGNPQPDSAYQNARGRSYQTTTQYAAATPWNTFDPNSQTAIHHVDLPPSNTGLISPDQCQVLAAAGFPWNVVDGQSTTG